MNPEITPEQKQQLNSWALQRDNILGDLAVKQIENDKLTTANKELAVSLTKIQEEINQSLGRLDEMTKKEEEFDKLMRIDISELTARQSGLQSQISELLKEIDILVSNKKVLTETIDTLVKVHEGVFGRVSDLDKNIEEARRIASENVTETTNLLVAMKGSLQEVIDINKANVEKANMIIVELPRMFFELQKQSLNRQKI